MRAIRVHETGGPEMLRYDEAPTPEPAPDQVRVKVAAVGLNYIDTYHRTGLYKMPLPFIPGGEFAGTIDAVGAEVQGWAVGDRVATASGSGGYAEYALAPAAKLVRVPENVELEQAAAVLLQGMTAHYLVTSTYPLKAGESCLVHAAAGGVGQLLVQFASQAGARVIATVSTEEKAAKARALGAAEVILYTKADFESETRRLTGGAGVDVAYDSVGKDTFAKSLGTIKRRGLCVLYGQASGAVPPFEVQTLAAKGSLFLTRMKLGDYIATRAELLERSGAVFDAVASGKLKIEIGGEFALKDAAEAHRKLGGRETTGKLVLLT